MSANYSPGLASAHAAEILKRRRRWGSQRCWSDPSMWAEYGTTNRWGRPATVATELHENGLDGLVRANRDRRGGYVRLLELLHVEPGRIPPAWADVPAQVGGAPRLYVFETCPNVAEQLKNARVKKDGKDAVEIV